MRAGVERRGRTTVTNHATRGRRDSQTPWWGRPVALACLGRGRVRHSAAAGARTLSAQSGRVVLTHPVMELLAPFWPQKTKTRTQAEARVRVLDLVAG